ncbi:MAG: hypothetical protein CMB22_04305 [Euryarchaeota archaeon]|nr:hypothetical protein [Euryarchaeota archaeon]|tara:strand:+ start:4132 stop:4701 length:570 start_codon:yes stop_codon:yes gene_type:complete
MMSVLSLELGIFILGILGASALLQKSRQEAGSDGTRGTITAGLLFATVGIIASGWTWSIHNSLMKSGSSSMCASEGLVQCGSVIGDPQWNSLFGMPWGVVGIASFGAIFFVLMTLYLDQNAKRTPQFVNYLWYLGIAGLPFVAWLVVVELLLVEGAPHICPYCTVIHLSMIGVFVSSHIMRGRRASSTW